jgi:hypothetical protein
MATRVLVLCAAAAVTLLSTLPGAAAPSAKSKKTSSAAVKVPTGTYMKTCRLCTLDQGINRYACECDPPSGKANNTYIDLATCTPHSDGFYYLENLNGTLTCANP